ncbi:hypothetical protein QYE76_030292 [Lolium multiflorum]|uniref:Uncharacterized protein n=1 Tax=Lolium multiflorum TaxID=4521 RepID=A0AAD8VHG6_LOLMU|nr:hypothetical protein QYE76_030292 [Lolium multiflorum]
MARDWAVAIRRRICLSSAPRRSGGSGSGARARAIGALAADQLGLTPSGSSRRRQPRRGLLLRAVEPRTVAARSGEQRGRRLRPRLFAYRLRRDYVHGSDEEEAVMAQTFAIREAEARVRFRREEANTVRQSTRRPAGRPASARSSSK